MSNASARLQTQFKALQKELLYINSYFKMFRSLFSKNSLREELNGIDGPFFSAVQKTFQRYIILELVKFLDHPTATKGRSRSENLSLRNMFVDYLNDDFADSISRELAENLNETAKKYFDQLSNLRNKFLAHSDKDVKLYKAEIDYPSIDKIIEVNQFCIEAMNFLENKLYSQTTMYSNISNADADGLVAFLVRGLRYEELRREGKIEYLDHNNLKRFD